MKVDNKVHHSAEQWEALAKNPDHGPVCMINLFKFKAKAEYPDGRDSQLTGIEAVSYTHLTLPTKRIV